MVSLEAKSDYLKTLQESATKWDLIKEILHDGVNTDIVEANQATPVAVNLIKCIKSGDKENAQKIYDSFAKGKPTKETSHWMFDEFVVFALVATVQKFKFDSNWVSCVLAQTVQTINPIERSIQESFRNILAGNFNANQDYHEISLVYQHIAKDAHYDVHFINQMFIRIWRQEFPTHESAFLNVISLKAVEVAFTIKGLLSPQDYFDAKEFSSRFQKRTNNIATVLSWFLLLCLATLLTLILWKLNGNKVYATVVGFLASIVGFGVSAVFGWRKQLQRWCTNLIQKGLGYRLFLPLD